MNPLEIEFNYIDQTRGWSEEYQKIREACFTRHDFSVRDAKRPEFKERNRYRDVSPYDHSRVRLTRNHLDYINASLVKYPEANRSYILTQGPLPKTSSHFWLMVWEQNSAAVLMLNRVVEMGRIKCHQYFPTSIGDKDELVFEDVGLRVSYISEEDANFYVIRTLDVEDLESGEKKRVLQFHYTTWPDFGVPESPEAFLNFLFAVREAGVLSTSVGPPVIHCSAGIGRSGTFCLVDTCLVLIEKQQHANINVNDVLIEMRKYRMGLIQTPDQLRFSYLAIIEGVKHVLPLSAAESDTGADAACQVLDQSSDSGNASSTDENDESPDLISSKLSPSDNNNPPITKLEHNDALVNASHVPDAHRDNHVYLAESMDGHLTGGSGDAVNEEAEEGEEVAKDVHQRPEEARHQEVVRRRREERKKRTAEQIARMKKKQEAAEMWRTRKQQMTPYLWGVSVAVLVASYMTYKYWVT